MHSRPDKARKVTTPSLPRARRRPLESLHARHPGTPTTALLLSARRKTSKTGGPVGLTAAVPPRCTGSWGRRPPPATALPPGLGGAGRPARWARPGPRSSGRALPWQAGLAGAAGLDSAHLLQRGEVHAPGQRHYALRKVEGALPRPPRPARGGAVVEAPRWRGVYIKKSEGAKRNSVVSGLVHGDSVGGCCSYSWIVQLAWHGCIRRRGLVAERV